jgi:hypothetical protein
MPPNARPRTGARSRAVAIGVAVLLFATALAVAAPTAGAAPQPVTTGGLDWGVKTSFRTYLSTVAAGTVTFADGATDNGNGTYHFPADSTSTFDPDAATTTASFRGSVHFVGHEGLLDITISNIRVRNAGAGGVLLADVVSVPFQGVNPPIPPSVTWCGTSRSTSAPREASGPSTRQAPRPRSWPPRRCPRRARRPPP